MIRDARTQQARHIVLAATVAALVSLLAPTANAASDGWERNGKDIISGFYNMYQPDVVQEPGEEYPFKMWFFGWSSDMGNSAFSGCDAIFHARSKDLDHWEVYSGDDKWDATGNAKLWMPVVTASDKYYDSVHNGDPSVVKHNGVYYMAMTTTGFDKDGIKLFQKGDTDGDFTCVLFASSRDGIHWTKASCPFSNPDTYGAIDGGAGDDLGPQTVIGGFARPSLMWDNDHWRLWFDYSIPGKGSVLGHAENRGDPMKMEDWKLTHRLEDPIAIEWPNPNVVKVDGKYHSFADPGGYPGAPNHPWKRRQLCEAVSDDGIHWTRLKHLDPDPDAPACQVPEATVITLGAKRWLYLFYACQIGDRANHMPSEQYDYRYDRIRYMRRPLPDKPASAEKPARK